MTINTAGYTVGSNYPLTNARILYAPITGTVTATGTNGAYAANDYTAQRWACAAGANTWTLLTAANANVDCVFIAAHNLIGRTITIQTNTASSGGTFVTRATITPTDNTTICALFNSAGTPYTIRQIRITVDSGAGIYIGIIRAGVALQMPIPIYGGHKPITLNRVTEAQQQFSETGQWLGRIAKRQAITTTYSWDYLESSWYDSTFEPFAKTLPLYPFGIAGNPSSITSDVGWVWTGSDVQPSNMGVKAYRAVSIDVTGYAG